jgi:hypothetical protein
MKRGSGFILIFGAGILVLLTALLYPCTGFIVAQGDYTFWGSNEDFSDPDTYIAFYPPEPGKYGRVYLGYSDMNPQVAMNDQGLCMDGFYAPLQAVTGSADKPILHNNIIVYILETCTTVSEALDVFNSYYLYFLDHCQLMVADRFGDAAIVEGDVIIRKKNFYQVATNFYQSCPELGGYPCWRYDTAVNMLQNVYRPDVPGLASILDATHQEGTFVTQFSTIFDLNKKLVYLFHQGDFARMISFSLADEMEKGEHYFSIPALFSDPEHARRIVPAACSLSENYPNPFNAETKFDLVIAEPSRVRLEIFDCVGRKVRTLMDEYRDAGIWRGISWDGSDDSGQPVSSGLYFCRLTTGNGTLARKLALLR